METKIFIYGPIGEFQTDGETVNGLKLLDVIMEVQSNPASTYYVHFNSPGGNVNEAELIQNYLTKLQERANVIAVGEGLVASAASKIYLSINKRSAKKEFKLMLHNPFGGVQGDATSIESYAEEMRRLEKEYESYYSERLDIDSDTISSLMDKETYLTYEECKKLNIINHELIQTPAIIAVATTKKTEKMDKETKNWFEQMFADIKTALAPQAEEPKALTLMSKEGVELVFPGESPAEGDRVNVPDGSYNVDYSEKSWIIVIKDGAVESLSENEPESDNSEELEALKTENADLKKKIQEVTANAEEVEKLKSQVEEMTAYVARHKAIQSKADPVDENQDKFKKPNEKEADPIQALLAQKRQQARDKKMKKTIINH